jgi:nucleotide-binding universal stress UspA family protein
MAADPTTTGERSASSIFVLLDGSPVAELALPYAEKVARATDARLLLAHVATLPEATRAAEIYLQNCATQCATTGIDVRTIVLVGDVAQAILHEVSSSAGRVIVVATRTRSGANSWLYGQGSECLQVQARAPLLVIPETTTASWREDGHPNILVALDGSAWSEAIVSPVKGLAIALRAEVVLVEVIDPAVGGFLVEDPTDQLARGRAYLQQVATIFRSAGVPVTVRAELGRPVRLLDRLAQSGHFDLLAMTTNGQGGRASPLLGSVVTEILERTLRPLLLARPEGEY